MLTVYVQLTHSVAEESSYFFILMLVLRRTELEVIQRWYVCPNCGLRGNLSICISAGSDSMLLAFCLCAANYMDNWKCTGILKGDGSPLTGLSGQPTAMSTVVGSSLQTSQNALNGMSAGR